MVVSISIIFIGLRTSLRIAGAMYRVQNEIDKVLSGKIDGHIKVRKDDEFQSFVNQINALLC